MLLGMATADNAISDHELTICKFEFDQEGLNAVRSEYERVRHTKHRVDPSGRVL